MHPRVGGVGVGDSVGSGGVCDSIGSGVGGRKVIGGGSGGRGSGRGGGRSGSRGSRRGGGRRGGRHGGRRGGRRGGGGNSSVRNSGAFGIRSTLRAPRIVLTLLGSSPFLGGALVRGSPILGGAPCGVSVGLCHGVRRIRRRGAMAPDGLPSSIGAFLLRRCHGALLLQPL
eukprot:scaffold14315_cov62-Phaeocystis_antarctica.AAC.1